ncbi:MAG: hypothetical protein BJ554DRAFT_4958 [Olpidium bornovanus]|uniref:Uncharacterized protein n=1 Tax=Olpidium bornovanus TaxID=278681 RepID=A0A8H8DEE7_9FUNG|nr:MAG: hypothetical protein BJ554DRAFT_4958 [Olpidium bornovanus]
MATEYTPDEIAFFKRTEVIVTADDEAFEVSSKRALKQTSKISGQLSKAQAQKLLDRLTSRGWLQYE